MKIVQKNRILTAESLRVHPYDFYNRLFSFGADGSEILCFYSSMDMSSAVPHSCYLNAAVQKADGNIEYFDYKFKKSALPIPAYWDIFQDDSTVKLDTGRYADVKDCRNRRILTFGENGFTALTEDLPAPQKKINNDKKEYVFGGLKIAVAKNSVRKLKCADIQTGKPLWTFKFVGYLYTEIKIADGIVYFGTAGQGGHFYGLDLESGELVHDINTRGTATFTVYKNRIFLPSQYGDLLMYNPADRSFEELNVGENCFINDEVEFMEEGGRLHFVIAERKDGDTFDYYIARIDAQI